jgi:Myb/SANT-like DNA-binding domain
MNFRKRRRLNRTDPYSLRSTAVYMSTRSKQNSDEDAESNKRAVWSHEEERNLVSALLKLANGSNIKAEMWNQVASSMEKPSKGPSKTAESCRTKWARVSDSILIHSTFVDGSAIPRSKKPIT